MCVGCRHRLTSLIVWSQRYDFFDSSPFGCCDSNLRCHMHMLRAYTSGSSGIFSLVTLAFTMKYDRFRYV